MSYKYKFSTITSSLIIIGVMVLGGCSSDSKSLAELQAEATAAAAAEAAANAAAAAAAAEVTAITASTPASVFDGAATGCTVKTADATQTATENTA